MSNDTERSVLVFTTDWADEEHAEELAEKESLQAELHEDDWYLVGVSS